MITQASIKEQLVRVLIRCGVDDEVAEGFGSEELCELCRQAISMPEYSSYVRPNEQKLIMRLLDIIASDEVEKVFLNE